MIEFAYEIVRNEGDEQRTYKPSIPTQLPDLVSIEGPNSSGKSTLLHILALGLFGLKNPNINESLQRKLKDLSGSDHQKLTFSFSIKNNRNNLEIQSEKSNPLGKEITVYETINGKRSHLSAEVFERKYNLIYDIPDDPLERLDELTKELKDRQLAIGQTVGVLKIQLRNTIKEIQSSADPKKLEAFRRELKDLTKLIDDLAKEKRELEADWRLLNRYFASKFYLEYRMQLDKTIERVQVLEKARKSLEKKEKTIKRRVKTLSSLAGVSLQSVRNTFQELCISLKAMGIKTKNDFLTVWWAQNIQDLFLQEEKHYILFDGIKEFRTKIRELDRALGQDGKLDEANFLAELIRLLTHYSALKTTLPGTDKTIPDFIRDLEKRYKECKDVKALNEKYTGTLTKLDELESNSRTFIQVYLPELRSVLEESKAMEDDQEDRTEDEIEDLKQAVLKFEKKMNYYSDELIRGGGNKKDAEAIVAEAESKKHLRPYSTYDEQELDEKLKDLEDQIETLEKRIGENDYIKSQHEHEIHRLEQQEPHKYQDRLEKLQGIFAQVQILEQKLLKEYDEHLKMIISRNVRRSELSANQKAYFAAVAVYLGQKVGSIRHVDKEYTVDKVDLIDRRISTRSGKTIMLTDLGTGQSQSAYLRGLLGSSDTRKVIALIDEVAMMDSLSMKPIYEILKKKYEEGSLLAGIVVQKGECLTVKAIQ